MAHRDADSLSPSSWWFALPVSQAEEVGDQESLNAAAVQSIFEILFGQLEKMATELAEEVFWRSFLTARGYIVVLYSVCRIC